MSGGAFKKLAGRASARRSPSAKEPSDFDVNASVLAMIPPIGAIIDYYRTDATIDLPDNWQVCDGNPISDSRSPMVGDNTPDLRGKFSRGKEDMSAMGSDSAGADSINLPHTHTTNNHTHNGPNHKHISFFADDSFSPSAEQSGVESSEYGSPGPNKTVHAFRTSNDNYNIWVNPSTTTATGSPRPIYTKSSGTDSTGYQSDSGMDSGNLSGVDNRPAYVGLIKIMRIF